MTRRSNKRITDDSWADDAWVDDDKKVEPTVSRRDRRNARRSKARSRTVKPRVRKRSDVPMPSLKLRSHSQRRSKTKLPLDLTSKKILFPGLAVVAVAIVALAVWMIPTPSSEPSMDGPFARESIIFDLPAVSGNLGESGYLKLVNRQHRLAVLPERSDMQDVSSVPVAHEDIALHASAYFALAQLFDSAQIAGAGPFHVISGFRDYTHQSSLYDQGQGSDFLLPAGHSEHHTGLAIDIVPTQQMQGGYSLSEQLDGTSECEQWLVDNSWRYGLILRYPEGKSDITGIAFEPWHFRYVGNPHAYYMWSKDLTLEEYLHKLQEQEGISIEFNNRRYRIVHDAAIDGILHLPSNSEFTLSSDNRDGYVITVWE